MKLAEIIELIDGDVYTISANLQQNIQGGCGADLMSDVLASSQPNSLLLTGLCTLQVIRTAQMADVQAIVFVRGKKPSPEMINLAEVEDIPLISSPYGMFELCGRLHSAGLLSSENCFSNEE